MILDSQLSKSSLKYKRVLLKLSGEMLVGEQRFGIDQKACQKSAEIILALQKEGTQVALVIGGGNIFRGIRLEEMGLERTPADHMGMMATLINGIAIQQALAKLGVISIVMSGLECPRVVETFSYKQAITYLERGYVTIFVGGTGNPYFTTDTAAALRACEIKASVLLKATKVDGIYDKDPLKDSSAIKFDYLTYSQVLADHLQVMDATAVALCRNANIPICVFNMKCFDRGGILSLLSQKKLGTLVTGEVNHEYS